MTQFRSNMTEIIRAKISLATVVEFKWVGQGYTKACLFKFNLDDSTSFELFELDLLKSNLSK